MHVIKQYLPTLGMVLAAMLQVLYTGLQDNHLSLTEFLTVALALVGAIVTYVVPRLPGVTWLKTACAGATAVLVFLVSTVEDGTLPNAQEWVMVAIQLLVGLGVVAATSKHVPLMTARRLSA